MVLSAETSQGIQELEGSCCMGARVSTREGNSHLCSETFHATSWEFHIHRHDQDRVDPVLLAHHYFTGILPSKADITIHRKQSFRVSIPTPARWLPRNQRPDIPILRPLRYIHWTCMWPLMPLLRHLHLHTATVCIGPVSSIDQVGRCKPHKHELRVGYMIYGSAHCTIQFPRMIFLNTL